MESVLSRTGSGPIYSSMLPGRFSSSQKPEVNNNRPSISRAISEPRAIIRLRSIRAGSQTFPKSLPNNELNKIGAHYQKMLKTDHPNNPLLLRNYSKFLHEVEGDTVKAEEYYARAILANPGDGELLSLYGKLIWDMQRNEERAQSYFDQAVIASPDDCMVMGSYAQFMWEADEDEDEESGSKASVCASQALLAAF
ncbi:uncharacterized protein LOC143601341 [Bidens hawaiensis]|uniref:uncharacterized protein LOC143601341 n=1 Tax=Bidens hawaiensis TaxID=980011 RepID=UPI00404966CA